MAKEEERKPVKYFDQIAGWAKHPGSRSLYYLFLPVFFFGFLGTIWMIPFPEIDFLKENGYHIYLNWASFLIAILIYCYLKIVPMLSYMVLLSIGAMSYLIVQLEYYEQNGGIAAWMIFLLLFLISLLILWVGTRAEENKPSLQQFLMFLFVGPLWVWHLVFKYFKIKH